MTDDTVTLQPGHHVLPRTLEKNGFLSRLPEKALEHLRPYLVRADLNVGASVYAAGSAREVTFPSSGLIVMKVAGAGMALIGCEGVIGGSLSNSIPAACDADVLIAGLGERVARSAFMTLLATSRSATDLAIRHEAAALAQAQIAAACAVRHCIEQRASRWLLEIADRTGTHDIQLTQAVLAELLGVNRTTLVVIMCRLEKSGAILQGRGSIHIADRTELVNHSCDCYQRLNSHVSRLFSPVVSMEPLKA